MKNSKFLKTKLDKDVWEEVYDELNLAENNQDEDAYEAAKDIDDFKELWTNETTSDDYLFKMHENIDRAEGLLISSSSSRIMIGLRGVFSLPNQYYRNGMWDFGYLDQKVSASMGLGNRHLLVFITTDKGVGSWKKFGFKTLPKYWVKEPMIIKSNSDIVTTHKQVIESMINADKNENIEKKKIILKEMTQKAEIKNIKIDKEDPSMEKMLDEIIAQHTQAKVTGVPEDVIKKDVRKILTEEKSIFSIKQMISTPTYLAHVGNQATTPYNLKVIKDHHLRSELEARKPGLADEQLLGQGVISKSVKETVLNSIELILALNHDNIDKISPAIENLRAVMADYFVKEEGDSLLNNSVLNELNAIMKMCNKPKNIIPNRPFPGKPFKKMTPFI